MFWHFILSIGLRGDNLTQSIMGVSNTNLRHKTRKWYFDLRPRIRHWHFDLRYKVCVCGGGSNILIESIRSRSGILNQGTGPGSVTLIWGIGRKSATLIRGIKPGSITLIQGIGLGSGALIQVIWSESVTLIWSMSIILIWVINRCLNWKKIIFGLINRKERHFRVTKLVDLVELLNTV